MPHHPHHRPSSTRRLALVTAAAIGGALLVSACAPWRIFTSVDLAKQAQPYTAQPPQPSQRLLVVGDSTALGTGASSPADSLAGLIGKAHPQWRIDNLAANGAKFGDVAQQLQGAEAGYDMVLVLAGGNDVIRLTTQKTLRANLEQTVALAREKGRTVVLMPCGNVGHAPFFVPPLSWAMSSRSERLHAMVQEVAAANQVRYVRLLRPRDEDPFVLRSDELNAADGLHPSSAGYAQWYQELVAQGGLAPATPGTSATSTPAASTTN
ncbi:SGNH/GDSL hydrolase family protein [Acidovorax sp. Leaf78]|uniref:SGNH/GDSL hydrolase family protein n=1 Tax=Acidovorax sp. Leaf78 TaxID=1736237 RepID=UPI0006F3E141|nr:SGNH/GDSL hydrolase family protein [Acidovorax sp. Leaf78]KQO19554.1 GDSL family lipase [Acidovorax sp. Leaf78]